MRSYLEFLNLQKAYPTVRGDFVAVEDFTLNVEQGEFVSIIGHSGCGKSTVLSMVAGLNSITSGSIVLANREVVGPGPDRGVVFQAPSLFPWMTALENVMLGVKKVFPYASKEERYEICRYYLTRVGLGQHLDKKAIDLSSGMQQRVGIARAFALKPKLLLLDEPFGMLDSLTRTELQSVLMEVWAKEKITAIMVTHDVDEAVLLSDRVVMMTNGPRAVLGDILKIDFPRPRVRSEILDTDQYYEYREYLIDFLERYEKAKPKTAA
jgi:nitrate ABC transporter ATP-binding subunit